MVKKIISLSGKKGSGKSYITNQIARFHWVNLETPVEVLSFADPVRFIVKYITGTNYTTEELKQDSVKDEVALVISGTKFTFRQLLQLVGTEMGRSIHQDIWVDFLERRLKEEDYINKIVAVDDTRFPNEIDYLNKQRSTSIYIDTPEQIEEDSHASEQHHEYLRNNCRYILNNKKDGSNIEDMLKIIL